MHLALQLLANALVVLSSTTEDGEIEVRISLLPLIVGLVVLVTLTDARRVRVRPRPVAEETSSEDQEVRDQRIQYYAAQPESDDGPSSAAGVVLIGDPYNGLYGQPAARGQTDTEYRSPLPFSGRSSSARPSARVKEPTKQPPVQTLRNYSNVNDDGSFTFGYEAADGSFKEETRGTDCVVRGKYGYVDPDGNKREFTYVSGNPCDPNAVAKEEEESKEAATDSGEENIPKGPIRPLRPLRPTASPIPRPTTTLFQENYNPGDEEVIDDAPQLVYQPRPRPQQPTRNPVQYTPSTYNQEQDISVHTPRPVFRQQPAVRITPRPPVAATTLQSQLPATTYRPQLLQVTPRPSIFYTRQQSSSFARPTPSPAAYPTSPSGPVDYDAELRKFQVENNVVTTPRSVTPLRPQPQIPRQQQPSGKAPSGNPIYESELVYDPSSGQYNTRYQLQSPLYPHQQNQHQQASPQGFYYIQPSASANHQQSISNGQIDAFLRGQSLAY
uniref:(California timema) hypothetical protein n=1 Tax=Timema californicum TaxID=61474 RepID=A0A7R9JAF2_TIMCA|nr:unnamed protein product [Timema californicum]